MVSTNARVPCFAQFTPWNNLNVRGQHCDLELWSRRVRSFCLSHIPWVILGKFFISLYILPVKCWERQLSLDLLHYYMCSLDCINTARPWLFYPGHFSRLFMQLIIMKDETFLLLPVKAWIPQTQCFSAVVQTTHQMRRIWLSHTMPPRWDSGEEELHKWVDAQAACRVMSNKVLCLWPRSPVSFASIQETVTGWFFSLQKHDKFQRTEEVEADSKCEITENMEESIPKDGNGCVKWGEGNRNGMGSSS